MSLSAVCISENICPNSDLGKEWEKLVRINPANGFMQSLHWAQAKNRQGLPSFHIGVFEDSKLVGGAIFYTSQKRNGAGILVAPEGPVLPWHNESLSRQLLELIIDTAQSHAGELGVMAMRIEPRLNPPLPQLLREFGKAPIDLIPRETLYIDLSLDPEVLLESMKPKGRYNIKLSQRHGVNVFEDKSADAVRRFHNIVQEASERDGFALEPLSFFENLNAVLTPAGLMKIFFAQHEDDFLGTLLLITYDQRATYLYGGITNTKRNLMGGYALQWQAMLAAKEAGCTAYDFYGFDPFRAPDHEYARFSQFKSQFGGTVKTFIGAHDYFFLDNLADAFIKITNQAQSENRIKEECLV